MRVVSKDGAFFILTPANTNFDKLLEIDTGVGRFFPRLCLEFHDASSISYLHCPTEPLASQRDEKYITEISLLRLVKPKVRY